MSLISDVVNGVKALLEFRKSEFAKNEKRREQVAKYLERMSEVCNELINAVEDVNSLKCLGAVKEFEKYVESFNEIGMDVLDESSRQSLSMLAGGSLLDDLLLSGQVRFIAESLANVELGKQADRYILQEFYMGVVRAGGAREASRRIAQASGELRASANILRAMPSDKKANES